MRQARSPDVEPIRIAVAVVRYEGRVLIGQRPPAVPLAGLWEFPGGKIRPGESPGEAAVRECLEETGLAIRLASPYPPVTHGYAHGVMTLHFFDAEPLEPTRPPAGGFRWVPLDELAQYPFPAANTTVLEKLSHESGAKS